jgi:uncharacterized damage-inducible protein DinB
MKKTQPVKKPSAKKPAKKSAAQKPEPKRAPSPPTAPAAKGKGGKASVEAAAGYDVAQGLMDSFATSNRITRYLLDNLHDEVWHAAPVGGRGRSVAAIACHLHNARVMWLASFGRKMKPPPKLDHLEASKADALKSLEASHDAIAKVIVGALRSDGKIANFKAGAAAFLSYLMTHDAHHRGQICLMAKQVGHPLPQTIGYGMWEWSKR